MAGCRLGCDIPQCLHFICNYVQLKPPDSAAAAVPLACQSGPAVGRRRSRPGRASWAGGVTLWAAGRRLGRDGTALGLGLYQGRAGLSCPCVAAHRRRAGGCENSRERPKPWPARAAQAAASASGPSRGQRERPKPWPARAAQAVASASSPSTCEQPKPTQLDGQLVGASGQREQPRHFHTNLLERLRDREWERFFAVVC